MENTAEDNIPEMGKVKLMQDIENNWYKNKTSTQTQDQLDTGDTEGQKPRVEMQMGTFRTSRKTQ